MLLNFVPVNTVCSAMSLSKILIFSWLHCVLFGICFIQCETLSIMALFMFLLDFLLHCFVEIETLPLKLFPQC